MKNKNFNIIIAGVGGQGLITLLKIISRAALLEQKDIKTSELHGLSQRGGSVETHLRIGKKIKSPLVGKGKADLIIGLELLESLRTLPYSNNETVFLIDKYLLPFPGSLSEEEIEKKIKKIKGDKYIIPAKEICQEKLENDVVSGVYLLSFAAYKKLIPLKPESILEAVSKIVPKKYFEINKKASELAKEDI